MEHLTEPQKKAGNEWFPRDCPVLGPELGTCPISVFTVALRSRYCDLHRQVTNRDSRFRSSWTRLELRTTCFSSTMLPGLASPFWLGGVCAQVCTYACAHAVHGMRGGMGVISGSELPPCPLSLSRGREDTVLLWEELRRPAVWAWASLWPPWYFIVLYSWEGGFLN